MFLSDLTHGVFGFLLAAASDVDCGILSVEDCGQLSAYASIPARDDMDSAILVGKVFLRQRRLRDAIRLRPKCFGEKGRHGGVPKIFKVDEEAVTGCRGF